MLLAEPVIRDIWSGTQADKQLMALELAESKICGGLLAAAIERVEPRGNPEAVAASALMIWQLCEATMRLAISLDRPEGDAIVAAFKRMTWQEISRHTTEAGHDGSTHSHSSSWRRISPMARLGAIVIPARGSASTPEGNLWRDERTRHPSPSSKPFETVRLIL